MAELKIKADTGAGTVSFKGPNATTDNAAVQLTLPVDDGTANQYLKTDGSGALSWASVSSTPEGEAILSTTNSNEASTKFLRADGDGTCSWQIPPAATATSGTDNFTISDGNLIIATAGHGIDFSATADADSGGETISNIDEVLDDYEEGRWTPTLKYSGAANCTYNDYSPKGRYVKVGQLVFVSGYIALTAKGSDNGSGYLEIHGLPFNSDGYANPDRPAYSGVISYWNNFSSVKNLGIIWGNNADKCYLSGGDGSAGLLQYGSLTDTSWFGFSLTYRANA